MASLFTSKSSIDCRLLDAGAGIGSLASAFLERCIATELSFRKIEVTAFELDSLIHEELNNSLASYTNRLSVVYKILDGDFIERAVNNIKFDRDRGFTHAILNPPYQKINSKSLHRKLLRQAGIETVNLYSAFVALALTMMAPSGQIVAILPRSFCNGPYYRPFRDFILERAAIQHIHLFDSRRQAFKDDDVLQENIILLLECGTPQGSVTVTTSTDNSFTDLVTHTHPFDRIVSPTDSERFIHVPNCLERSHIELSTAICYSLEDIGIKVSTGPVVDFRLKVHLREMSETGTVPLLYPAHFTQQNIEWPKPNIKKPNAIDRNSETEKWLYPNGFYCLVRRFSSKEEKHRIVANVLQPDTFGDVEMLGLENHLNVYHENKHGLPETLARGLAVYLNTTSVDENFRRSSGHTQVNATDLKMMKYPSRKALMELGEWAMRCGEITQTMIGSPEWHDNLTTYLSENQTLAAQYAMDREQNRVPVQITPGKEITLSPGEHSNLIRAIVEDFAPRFAPGSVLVYVGDTGEKWGYFDAVLLAELGVNVDSHGKMPDVVLHFVERNWLLLVESVTSHGPVDGKRHAELAKLFASSTAGLVYVTAFPNRAIMSRYLSEIAWETEVWVADAPSHLIHFNGVRFLGPYNLN